MIVAGGRLEVGRRYFRDHGMESPMTTAAAFLAQLDRETGSTRRLLERVPKGRASWRPHDKSMPLSDLAAMIATMPGWIESMALHPELDLTSPDGATFTSTSFQTTGALVAAFDAAIARGRAALESTSDTALLSTWRMLVGGRVVAQHVRHQVICDHFSHWAHHRGQLTVYLRLLDVPVPCIYGPTADEAGF
jgi:uncharacterized damage-inducible protein DinB